MGYWALFWRLLAMNRRLLKLGSSCPEFRPFYAKVRPFVIKFHLNLAPDSELLGKILELERIWNLPDFDFRWEEWN